ncbi:MAG: sel1 repeat family protein [Lachnospiraceae bacterium]|nr:sel1 repeat family protein [Lachnospiraceae bacterium]
MTALFDDRVEKAIQTIWFERNPNRREEALALLREAANTGDGDAYYFLGRCYLGSSYVDPVVEMPVDRAFAFECFNMSFTFESAVGMFGTMHQEGYEPPAGTFIHPPYHSKKEIWDAVLQKAKQGHLFCKYLLANAYYYCTVSDFLDITPENVGIKKYGRYQYEWTASAVKLYAQCVAGGLGIAIPNLVDILRTGRYGAPVQRQKATNYIHIGADMGIGVYERMVGNEYRNNNKPAKAVEMYERALSHKDTYAYYCLGKLYTYNGILPLDLKKALSYLERGYALLPDDAGFCNLLGEIYFRGGQNIKPDYEQAFLLLSKAYFKGSTWGADMLGTCYLNGLGTAPNLNMARKLFELHPKKPLAVGGLRRLNNGTTSFR